MEILLAVFSLLGFTLVLSTGVFTGYLALLTGAAIVGHPRRKPTGAAPPPRHRFAVVIPAHDEALTLPVLLRSLERLEYPRELYEIVVVADTAPTGRPASRASVMHGCSSIPRARAVERVSRCGGPSLRYWLKTATTRS